MKWLLDLLDRLRPVFGEGGRLRAMKPVFDAADGLFFLAPEKTKRAPHARDPLDVKRYMTAALIAVLPCMAAGVYFFGLRVLAMIAVSYAVGGAIEVLFSVVRKEELNEGFLVTGLIFPLVLPPGLPLWMVAVGIAFGVVVGKELFGGTGRNLFNPALVGRCFLALGYPAAMSSGWIAPGAWPLGRLTQYAEAAADAVSSATPLVEAKQGVMAGISALLAGNVSGSVGETSAVLILIGGLFLVATRVANWRTVAGALGSFVVLGALMQVVRPQAFGPVVWHVFAGGLLFGFFFMATDPVTSPITNGGKWTYGIIIGCATLLIRNLTGYVEGVMFAILLGNIVAPLLDEVSFRIRIGRLQRAG